MGNGFDVVGGREGRCGVIVRVFCSLAMYVALVMVGLRWCFRWSWFMVSRFMVSRFAIDCST